MKAISTECMESRQSELEYIFDYAGEYVLVREYIAVHGVGVGPLDDAFASRVEACASAEPDVCQSATWEYAAQRFELLEKTGYGKSFYDQFVVQFINPWVSDADTVKLPGFKNSTCSFNWRTFACFCNAAARKYRDSVDSGTDHLSAYLASVDSQGVISDDCDGRIMTDPVYDWLATLTPNVTGGGAEPGKLPGNGTQPGKLPGNGTQPGKLPGNGMQPVKAENEHKGPPWWVWGGLVGLGTWLIWPIAFGKTTRR